MNCRGYIVSQFMQPEPAKYSRGPNIEATTFMQPEHPYFAHHPGRFFYIKDEDSGEIFSAPYEPTRNKEASFEVSFGTADIQWKIRFKDISVELMLTLPKDAVAELWQCTIKNLGSTTRRLSVYPYFSVGYMSWMNQSASFNSALDAIVCSSISPYQKLEDYDKNNSKHDVTYLLCQKTPSAWECSQKQFEGEGGLHAPDAVLGDELSKSTCDYETPVAAVQYQLSLQSETEEQLNFVFGAAKNKEEVSELKKYYFPDTTNHAGIEQTGFERAIRELEPYVLQGQNNLKITSDDEQFDAFTNNWLTRQVFYHGDVNRLTTDPQTRNYLQDAMGMVHLAPEKTKNAIIKACEQQKASGALPDGILLDKNATLKYINQIPHTDHNVWLVITLVSYLTETGEYSFLDEVISGKSLFNRVNECLSFLVKQRDERGLSFIAQGDWCDPMNMVGPKGIGVSTWLSLASAYVLNLWAEVCSQIGEATLSERHHNAATAINDSVNKHCWRDSWYARGITDDGNLFGIESDSEGRIYLNAQSWALLSGASSPERSLELMEQVQQQLETPYGPMMLAPAYTKMRDDVGRLTQKFPGCAENGSVYNHAAIFYVFSLYKIGQKEKAFTLLQQMLPNEERLIRTGQLPVFIPNYYRGAYYQLPNAAGKSSGLFNTGTVAWYLSIIIEELFGLKGTPDGLSISPQIPNAWENASIVKHFRGAIFCVKYKRSSHVIETECTVDEQKIRGNTINDIEAGRTYNVEVTMPIGFEGI